MVGDRSAWVSGLGVPAETAGRFEKIAEELDLSAADLIGTMVAGVVEADERMRRFGLHGVGAWGTKRDAADALARQAVDALPIDVRPSGFMWPRDVPFPWTADECKAAVIGYQVRWRGEAGDFSTRLRGLWEMSDGYAFLLQR